MTPPVAKGEAMPPRAGVSHSRAPAHTLPGQMQLAPGQRQVDFCSACNLTFAAATEPWCPICSGELQTMDLLPHPPFMM
jgi:hypothetical protein